MFRFFKSSFFILAIGLVLAVLIGAWEKSAQGAVVSTGACARAGFEAGFIALVLAALEISLSFDNAVVNASVLQNMTALWRHRFLTWGMLIAVFIMRLVLPLGIVAIVARLNPFQALRLAIFQPAEYATVMSHAHFSISVFGGTFLLMVATHFFLNDERDGLWLPKLERPLASLGRFRFAYALVTLISVTAVGACLPSANQLTFGLTSLCAVIAYLAVHGLSELLAAGGAPRTDATEPTTAGQKPTVVSDRHLHRASAAMFIYLEILDGSFSFDGVVGAFAITEHLLIITIGLSIGAIFVRSLTLMLVEKKSLTDYVYLEAGAFYAIGLLGALLFVSLFTDVPEVLTGLSGLTIIGLAWNSSHRHNRLKPR